MSSMTVNGEPLKYMLPADTPLLWALRDASNLTGAKHGCDNGECGACTVLVDGQAVKSCQATLATLEGADITTIEELSQSGNQALRTAWLAEQVGQCGFCEPGMVVALTALLRVSLRPGKEELAAIENICRCGIGPRVKKAVMKMMMDPAAQATSPGARISSRFSNGSSDAGQDNSQ